MALCLVAACAGPTVNEKTGPRGLRADQHLEAASAEGARSSDLTRWPEARSGADGSHADQQLAVGSWFGHWDTATEHDRLARTHRSAAAQLEAEYEEACPGHLGRARCAQPDGRRWSDQLDHAQTRRHDRRGERQGPGRAPASGDRRCAYDPRWYVGRSGDVVGQGVVLACRPGRHRSGVGRSRCDLGRPERGRELVAQAPTQRRRTT